MSAGMLTTEAHLCSLFNPRRVNTTVDRPGGVHHELALPGRSARRSDDPETAAFLRVSEGVAYDMARQYRRTNGRLGLPVFMAGRRMMRVAKLDLVRYINGETGRAADSSD